MEGDSSEDEENDYANIINKHRVEIVRCLDLDRQFMLSHLRSHHIFDTEDCELILSSPSSQQKNAKFLDTLVRKGPGAFECFVKGLEIDHAHLFEVITGKPPVSKMDCQTGMRICLFSQSATFVPIETNFMTLLSLYAHF